MRSGLLNERMTVYELQHTTDANGAKTTSLAAKGSYWCHVVTSRRDRDASDTDRVVYNPDIRFELRASVPISEDDIVEHDSHKYVIDMIEKNHNRDIQTLHCSRYEQ